MSAPLSYRPKAATTMEDTEYTDRERLGGRASQAELSAHRLDESPAFSLKTSKQAPRSDSWLLSFSEYSVVPPWEEINPWRSRG
jgi:hypothetical protein